MYFVTWKSVAWRFHSASYVFTGTYLESITLIVNKIFGDFLVFKTSVAYFSLLAGKGNSKISNNGKSVKIGMSLDHGPTLESMTSEWQG